MQSKLSNDLNVITAEINAYQRVAGEAIFEIGRRLKHVKENDLVHGEWSKWCDSIGMTRQQADRFIVVYEEFGSNDTTSCQLGLSRLYEIATLPPDQREVEHELPSGEMKKPEDMTVRELRELKRQLKEAERRAEIEQAERERLEAENEELARKVDKPPKVETEYIEVKDEKAPRAYR